MLYFPLLSVRWDVSVETETQSAKRGYLCLANTIPSGPVIDHPCPSMSFLTFKYQERIVFLEIKGQVPSHSVRPIIRSNWLFIDDAPKQTCLEYCRLADIFDIDEGVKIEFGVDLSNNGDVGLYPMRPGA